MPLATIDRARLDEDGDTVRFEYRDDFDRLQNGLVIRLGDRFYAVQNRCPHRDTPLDADGEGVADEATGELVCQTHGARFDPETGQCTLGPCRGQSLRTLRVETDGDELLVRRPGLRL